MASSGGMKGFYKQQKKKNGGTGISKPKPKPSPSSLSNKSAGFIGSGSRSGPAEMDLHVEGGEEELKQLREFDLDMRYGPCIGMSRMERWDRASSMGLNPPPHIESILLQSNPSLACCLWEGRV